MRFEEFGEMTQRTWREKSDWVSSLEWWSLREVVRSSERREMIGTRRRWEVNVGDRGEEIGG